MSEVLASTIGTKEEPMKSLHRINAVRIPDYAVAATTGAVVAAEARAATGAGVASSSTFFGSSTTTTGAAAAAAGSSTAAASEAAGVAVDSAARSPVAGISVVTDGAASSAFLVEVSVYVEHEITSDQLASSSILNTAEGGQVSPTSAATGASSASFFPFSLFGEIRPKTRADSRRASLASFFGSFSFLLDSFFFSSTSLDSSIFTPSVVAEVEATGVASVSAEKERHKR